MGRQRNHYLTIPGIIFLVLPLPITFLGTKTSHAFNLGKIYDSSNWQEIEDIATPSLVNWVKRGEFIIKTEGVDFDFELEKDFLFASRKNLGKFDVDDKGLLVEEKTQKRPKFIYGLPFPSIYSQDQKAGEKIMANFQYGRMRMGGYIRPNRYVWLGKEGPEREIRHVIRMLHYQGRSGGPIQNSDNFLYQGCINVVSPMDLVGTVQLIWEYNDERPATYFYYAPMTRRIARALPNIRSNSFLGSDMCSDDNDLWAGKNQSFRWKLLGSKEILCCFSAANKMIAEDMADGTVKRLSPRLQLGFEIPNWQGASWEPVNAIWSPRPVWIVEGLPKDPDYNYGKILFYVDKHTFIIWVKEIYNKSGEYWKTLFAFQSLQLAPSGRNNLFYPDAYMAVDDQKHHATYQILVDSALGVDNVIYCPESVIGPKDFSSSAAQKLSK